MTKQTKKKLVKRLTVFFTNVLMIMSALVLAAYGCCVSVNLPLPFLIHWAMPFVIMVFVYAADQ